MRWTIVPAMLVVTSAAAQQAVTVEVRDDVGTPVAYALVATMGGAMRVANDAGVAEFRLRTADSLEFKVRRIGYREFTGWVRRDGSTYRVTLPRVAAALSTVEVTAAGSTTNTPLMQRGFYDRIDRVQRGAILADFFTPEQLDERPFSSVTQMIAGSRYARVSSMRLSARTVRVIVGRGGCPMTIMLDGEHLKGTVQDAVMSETPQSINPAGTRMGGGDQNPLSVDELVDGRSIMAIEVYPSTANAPAELQRLSGRGSCGIVALWTGGRR